MTPVNGRSWLLRCKIGDKRRHISLGDYPDVTLAQARDRARDARALEFMAKRNATLQAGPYSQWLRAWQRKPRTSWARCHAVTLDVMRPLQALFDSGGRARTVTALVKALAEAKAAGVDPALALRLVDWQ